MYKRSVSFYKNRMMCFYCFSHFKWIENTRKGKQKEVNTNNIYTAQCFVFK